MPLPPAERRALAAQHRQSRAAVALAADKLTDEVAAHVRQAFGGRDALKVRVNAHDHATTDAVGAWLVEHVPCEVVERRGRVLLLYRATAGVGEGGESAGGAPAPAD
ncbi:MAG: YhbY family RNA-binding protein [Phycisphaerae bacterium]